jgi:hypothetical protein
MEDCRDKTIDAFNEYVNSLKHLRNSGTRLSLTTFDSESLDLVFDAQRVADVPNVWSGRASQGGLLSGRT